MAVTFPITMTGTVTAIVPGGSTESQYFWACTGLTTPIATTADTSPTTSRRVRKDIADLSESFISVGGDMSMIPSCDRNCCHGHVTPFFGGTPRSAAGSRGPEAVARKGKWRENGENGVHD